MLASFFFDAYHTCGNRKVRGNSATLFRVSSQAFSSSILWFWQRIVWMRSVGRIPMSFRWGLHVVTMFLACLCFVNTKSKSPMASVCVSACFTSCSRSALDTPFTHVRKSGGLGLLNQHLATKEKAGTIKLEMLTLIFPLVFGGEAGSPMVALSLSVFTLADELPWCVCSLDWEQNTKCKKYK